MYIIFLLFGVIALIIQTVICFNYLHKIMIDKINNSKTNSIFIKNISLPSLLFISFIFVYYLKTSSFTNTTFFYTHNILISFSLIVLIILSLKIYKSPLINKKNISINTPNETIEIIQKLTPLFLNLKKEEIINDDLNLNDFKKEIEEKNLKINFGANEMYYLYNELNFSISLEKFIQHFKNKHGKNFNYGTTRNAKDKILNDSREKIDNILKKL